MYDKHSYICSYHVAAIFKVVGFFSQTSTALSDLMMKAIDEGLEGLVLKDLKVQKPRSEELTMKGTWSF